MNRIVPLITIALLLTGTLAAQKRRPASVQAKPRGVDAIVERYLTATGGRNRWAAITSIYSKGVMTSNGRPNGTVEVFQKTPLKYLKIFHGTETEVRVAYDGKRSWSRFNKEPAQFATDPQNVAAMLADVDLRAFLNFKQRFTESAARGTETIDGKKCNVIEMILVGTSFKYRLYFDAATGLLVRRHSEVDDEGTRKLVVEVIDDYRPTGAVKLPFHVLITIDGVVTEYRYTEIKANTSIDDRIFDPETN